MGTININIKSSNDQKYQVEVDTDSLVSALKETLAEKAGVPVERQRLIYSGKVLKNDETIGSYKVSGRCLGPC